MSKRHISALIFILKTLKKSSLIRIIQMVFYLINESSNMLTIIINAIEGKHLLQTIEKLGSRNPIVSPTFNH